jgi:hypothetical protein
MAAQKWNIVVQVSINAFDVVCIAFVAYIANMLARKNHVKIC